jgi:O-antigen/teichoic acid export membrane protein
LLLSLVTVPAYLHIIGASRYGVLAIVWVVLGYFGVFDLGLSRATANQIARMRDAPARNREQLFWTALSINASLGMVGGVVLFLFGRVLVADVLKIGPSLQSEAIGALPWLALAVPLTTMTLVLAGTLEGREQFLTVNGLTIAGLTMYQLAPLAYAYWVGPALPGLIMSTTLALLASTALSFVVTAVSLPVSGRPRIEPSRIGELVRYGGWITLSGLVSPILTVFDRVLIGTFLSARAVAFYTIPYLLVNRVQIISSSLSRTLFPRFSMLGRADAVGLGRDAVSALLAIMTPAVVTGLVLLEPFLNVWLGSTVTDHSAPVGEILLMGMWVNSLAVVPYAFLQAQGRPDLPAKFHLLEVFPYIAMLILGLYFGGISGAAWVWAGRAIVDAVLLFGGAKAVPSSGSLTGVHDLVGSGLIVTVTCLASLTVFSSAMVRVAFGCALILLSLWWGWRLVPGEARVRLRKQLTSLRLRRDGVKETSL